MLKLRDIYIFYKFILSLNLLLFRKSIMYIEMLKYINIFKYHKFIYYDIYLF